MIEEDVNDALRVLQAGGIVCIPTETSYGLAVDARNEAALFSLAQLKGRDDTSPFSLIVASIAMAKKVSGPWPLSADELAAQFWPGPLTLVLAAKPNTAARLLGPTAKVAIRVSSHSLTAQLVSKFGSPITATSANPTGLSPAQEIGKAKEYFGTLVSYYLDDGECIGEASTLVEFDALGQTTILRPGPVIL